MQSDAALVYLDHVVSLSDVVLIYNSYVDCPEAFGRVGLNY